MFDVVLDDKLQLLVCEAVGGGTIPAVSAADFTIV